MAAGLRASVPKRKLRITYPAAKPPGMPTSNPARTGRIPFRHQLCGSRQRSGGTSGDGRRVRPGCLHSCCRMDAHRTGLQYKAVRKGGTVSILGVYGAMDKFPVGVMMNKRLTVRTAQQHGQKYVPKLLSTPSKVSWTHLPWRRTGYPWSNPCGDRTCSRTKPTIVG